MPRQLLALACLLTCAAATAAADRRPPSLSQVIARQGPVDARRRFKSPMIMETVLPVAPGTKRTQFGKDIADFLCDDVSLDGLTYQIKGNRNDPACSTELEFVGWVVVPNSFDRQVDVVMTIRRGTETLGSRGRFKISAEEGRRTPFRFRVPVSRLDRVTDRADPPVVEITLTVRDNS